MVLRVDLVKKWTFLRGPSDKVIIYFRYNFSRILRWKLKFLIGKKIVFN